MGMRQAAPGRCCATRSAACTSTPRAASRRSPPRASTPSAASCSNQCSNQGLTTLSSRLEQLDRIAVRVLELDLLVLGIEGDGTIDVLGQATDCRHGSVKNVV